MLSLLVLLSTSLMWADFKGVATEEKITEILVDLGKRPVGEPGTWGGAFAIIQSTKTERFVQFIPSEPGRLSMNIPISSDVEIFINDAVLKRLMAYLRGWKLTPAISTPMGVDLEDGASSTWRMLDVEMTISSSDYAKFITGIFTECFGEKPPLGLKISYYPEG